MQGGQAVRSSSSGARRPGPRPQKLITRTYVRHRCVPTVAAAARQAKENESLARLRQSEVARERGDEFADAGVPVLDLLQLERRTAFEIRMTHHFEVGVSGQLVAHHLSSLGNVGDGRPDALVEDRKIPATSETALKSSPDFVFV